MFTGLIECTGRVVSLRRGGDRAVLEVAAPLPAGEICIGDSIAVNGACLTVIDMQGDRFSFDVSPETVTRTTFAASQPGSPVNLERALRLGGRLDGHLVTGHIDCVGRLESRVNQGNAVVLGFSLPRDQARMLVEKGSVAIDGISLTVNGVSDTGFSVSIIPHTLEKTTLAGVGPGKNVNIETDVIGKYVVRLVGPHGGSGGLTMNTLMQNGFI
ncbi:MAG: riboflavin synthase [Trichlorobacter sp.]|uniref:riboflavin synthase n=1 Tax=Trichlorobacter sp. TaxID=2911007 RepID=UPI002563D458|nr:riboflavin synthase [Trichlorobacter sp.]MDK9719062.1 riboflavin synthase [Trichlorobacter sp.]